MGVASNVQTGTFCAGVFSSESQEPTNAFIAFSPRPPIKAERLGQAHIGEPREGRYISARKGGRACGQSPPAPLVTKNTGAGSPRCYIKN